MKENDSIEISVWVKRGVNLVRRDALDFDDPDHPYNYIKSLGHVPEEYGYTKPKGVSHMNCPCCGYRCEL